MTLKYYLCTEFFRQNDKYHGDISAFVSFEERSPFHICHCQRDYSGCCTIWILNYSTGIPRLARSLVARFHFTQIFVAAQKDLHNAVL